MSEEKIDIEMWALKDVERNTIVRTKWGRSTWTRKPHVNNLPIIPGYYGWELRDKLKPIKITVKEI
tara:strand:- start:3981 stop:4178 length:198 start_codon:yes stop_codon:yes gene_type:complete